jgi:hypothetical protein
MKRKHRMVVEVTFFEPVTEREARQYIDMNLEADEPSAWHDDVQKVYKAKNFERVLAKETAKR